jgi:DNA-binding response OmpR family regulator
MADILIADDQPGLREPLRLNLQHEGHRVTNVNNAEAIWSTLKDSRPDLVLLSLHLDGFENWETFRELKKKYPKYRVILYVNESTDDLYRLKHTISRALAH